MNIDKIYQDFTEKMLPKIADGMVITKDYFADLFGRYIKYLIITDSLTAVICFSIAGLGIYLLFFRWRENIIKNDGEILFFVSLGLILIPLTVGGDAVFNVIKDIYIPEVRLWELLSTKI